MFPQPKISLRTDYNFISSIQDQCQITQTPKRNSEVPKYKKSDKDFPGLRFIYATVSMPARSYSTHDHRYDTIIMKIMLHYEKEANVQSIRHRFPFVLGTMPNRHSYTFPHFLLPHTHVPGKWVTR